MKKTLYVLFAALLMFCGNIEVFANTNQNTQESDGGGETIDNPNEEGKVCKYRYTADLEVQVRYSDNDLRVTMVDVSTGENISSTVSKGFNYDEWLKYVNKGVSGCPYSVVVARNYNYVPNENCSSSAAACQNPYELAGYKIQLEKTNFWFGLVDSYTESLAYCSNCDEVDFDFIYNSSEFDCKSLVGEEMISLINQGLSIIKIIVPILVIGLGVFDFVRAVFASSEDDMKKAQKTFVRRLIIAVIIFFSPVLINLVINITNEAAGFVNSGTCGIG